MNFTVTTFDGCVAVAVAEAEDVVEALALALALALAVDADTLDEALAVAVAVAGFASAVAVALATPRMMGAPASAELPPEPPHPARSMTAHAMTAPAAFALRLLEPNPLNRLLRALIVGLASPGLCPITVHVFVTIVPGGSAHYRVNTVIFKEFCPVCGDLSDYTTLGRPLRDDQRRAWYTPRSTAVMYSTSGSVR